MRSYDSDKLRLKHVFGKTAYGIFFVVIIPVLIILWGKGLDRIVKGLPMVGTPAIGWTLVAAGFALVVIGWYALMRYGKGLPMNAFPPKLLVQHGIYGITPHPIYFGFIIMTAGYFMAAHSSAGFWLVTPCVALGSSALVLGYERPDMIKRFGTADWQTFLHLPAAEDSTPSFADRASSYVLVFLPWLVLYEAAITLGPAADSVESYFAFEYMLPVVEWTEVIYAVTYLFVLAAPLVCRRKCDLRRFMIMGWLATAAGGLCFILFPLIATPRLFHASGMWGEILLFERSMDGSAGAFPSFHVIWSLLAALLYSHSVTHIKNIGYLFAVAIGLSCITTGMHSLLDILAGVAVFIFVLKRERLWFWMLRTTERIANSWREWRIGRMRIINHGVYPAIGVFLGIIIAAHLAGTQNIRFVLLVSLAALIGAGLWGQAIEGSSKLSRPFGYFGGIFGAVAGILCSAAFGADGWLLLAAFSVAASFVQALGRLRCLVQGCCHGRECQPHEGIRFTHKRSRVLALANLGDRSIYPTQLYSILYNLVLGALLIRAWTLSAPMPFITGAYFILSSLGRFVEESYRGEPQTPKYAGLSLYQWLSLTGVAAGAILTTIEGKSCNTAAELLPWVFVYSVIFAFITAFAMGVDFPESKRRFSRLA